MEAALLESFAPLPDPRVDRTKRYPLNEILLLVISATLSGCEGWKQMKDFGETKLEWLRQFLPYAEGVPVDDTIARLMRKLNTKCFEHCFIKWMQGVCSATQGDIIPIDGKTLRRSHNAAEGKSAIHMVSAWSTANSVVLGQEKVDEKSNEITAIPELLKALEIKGCIVTIDAMGCQKDIAKQIVGQKGDYVLSLKGNHSTLHSDVKGYFETAYENQFQHIECDYHETLDNNEHGRFEKRQCWIVPANDRLFHNVSKWAGLNSVAMVRSERTVKGKTSVDVRFFITSLLLCAQTVLTASRKHWAVENSLHWTLDVTFREDESRVRKGASPENLAIMRHIALNLLRKDKAKNASIKRKRIMAALDDHYRKTLIQQGI